MLDVIYIRVMCSQLQYTIILSVGGVGVNDRDGMSGAVKLATPITILSLCTILLFALLLPA